MTVLVPEPILQALAPGIVEDFHASHRPKKIDRKATYDPVRDSFVFTASGSMTTWISLLSDFINYSSRPQRQRIAWSNQP